MFIVQSASPGHNGHMWMWEFFLSSFFWSFSFFLVLVHNVTFCVNVIARLKSIAMPSFSICTFRRDFRSCGTAASIIHDDDLQTHFLSFAFLIVWERCVSYERL